jgi:hypothetical protein
MWYRAEAASIAPAIRLLAAAEWLSRAANLDGCAQGRPASF